MDIEKIPKITKKEKDILGNFIKEKKKFSCDGDDNDRGKINVSKNIDNLNEVDFSNKIKSSDDFIDLFFVIGINQKDYKDCTILVQTQGQDKECNELFKTSFSSKEEKYYQILYNIKLKKTSKFCSIKILSKQYNKHFKSDNQNIYLNDEPNFVFENLYFKSFKIGKFRIWDYEINPPKILDQDFDSIFNTYYSYIYKLNPKNMKLINQLIKEGVNKLKDSNFKYTMNFFLQLLSLSFAINDNNLFFQIIYLFNENSLINNNRHQQDVKEKFELLLKKYEKKDFQIDTKIELKFDNIISICYLILYDVRSAIKFIEETPYKLKIIDNIISHLDYFKCEVFNKEFLNFLLKNQNKNDNNSILIISKSLNFVDYIGLIDENIELFEKTKFKLCEEFKFENYGKPEDIIPKIINIIKNCQNFILNSKYILKYYPNFIDILSFEQREELYNLIKDHNDDIRKLIYNKNYKDANNNSEIINFINSFILWKFPEYQNDFYRKLKKLDFQNILPSDLEKLKKIFQNFNLDSPKEREMFIKVFFLVLDKFEDIYEIPNILWNLFEYNKKYTFFSKENLKNFAYKYLELFQKNKISNSRENLFKLINQTLNWLIINIK